MNLMMGSQRFQNVVVPLLWGTRAILQDRSKRISIIDLAGEIARLEVLGDSPAPDTEFRPSNEGLVVKRQGRDLYLFSPTEKLIRGISVRLPECQILSSAIRVGSNTIAGGMVSGFGVGIAVDEHSISIGAPLPPGLAKLQV